MAGIKFMYNQIEPLRTTEGLGYDHLFKESYNPVSFFRQISPMYGLLPSYLMKKKNFHFAYLIISFPGGMLKRKLK